MNVRNPCELVRNIAAAAGIGSLLLLNTACGASADSSKGTPNIIFIVADQLRSHALGCYGNDQINTPNIDRLAREGAKFTNAISTAPVCSPFRGMLMTGNYPMKNGMVLNDHFLRNPTPYFAEVCKEAGYRTGYIGKWHLDGNGRSAYIPPERRRGFEYWRALECTHSYFASQYQHQDEKRPRTWKGYDAIAQTESACQYIEDQKTDPFCLFLSWGPPHNPYMAPDKYMKRFENRKITLRQNVNDFEMAEKMWRQCDTAVGGHFQRKRKRGYAKCRNKNNAAIIDDYRGYYAAIETLDDCIGRLLDALDRTGKSNNSIVVFTSDHGDNLGSHRQVGKTLPYEESISIPFIVRYPEKIKPNSETDALLGPVDMMPTVLSLAGVAFPKVDGKDISSAAMGNDSDVQDAVLIMKSIPLSVNWIVNGNGAWRGVRTKRYTYARKSYDKKPWMLFDNQRDPYQLRNLVDDPAHAELLKKLDKKTDQLLALAGDPEDPEVYAKLIQRERDAHGVHGRWEDLMPDRVEPGSEFDY